MLDSVTTNHQLEDLLADPGFLRATTLVSTWIVRAWNHSEAAARRFVLSAIGEPTTLGHVHRAWSLARQNGSSLAYMKRIVRLRVLDLLRKDARRAGHCSLPLATDSGEEDGVVAVLDRGASSNPYLLLERQQIIQRIGRAIDCFAMQGDVQQRQADLLRRYIVDESSYLDLSAMYACKVPTLRVRIHDARNALREYIRAHYPELL